VAQNPQNHSIDLRVRDGSGSDGSQGIPYHVAHTAITMAVASSYPVHSNLELYSLYSKPAEINEKLNFIDVPNSLKNIRILGLMTLISYMIVILWVWMTANYDGYIYFLAGEPNPYIKYTEWLLGFTGIVIAVDLLHKEIKEIS
jgi:hypothetical protein